MTLCHARYDSPIGPLHMIADARHLLVLAFAANWPALERRHPRLTTAENAICVETRRQLDAYFAGTRRTFTLPLAPSGTAFERAAWDALRTIPYGMTASYREQAAKIGRPAASRAVGRANGQNPVSIILPCHRVIASSGALAGYAGGLAAKRFLLDHEQKIAATKAA